MIEPTVDNQQTALAVAPQRRELQVIRMDELLAFSGALLKSRMLPSSLRRPEQVAAVILRGRELGIGPMEALMSINVIKGKVVSSTQLMLALIYRSGFLEDIEMVRGDPAKVTMKRTGTTAHTATFGSEDAKRADLSRKDNYKKWPEVMYMWRAIAICARIVFPDVVGAVYSADELGVEMRSDVVNGQYEEYKSDNLVVKRDEVFAPPARGGRIKELAEKGMSVEDIAVEVGKPLPVVKAVLKE